MKKIESIIQRMMESYIFEDMIVCENCDLCVPVKNDIFYGYGDDCFMADTFSCPQNILWGNSQKIAEAILNLDCVKQSKVLFSALNKEVDNE
jgi:hypothetical protein